MSSHNAKTNIYCNRYERRMCRFGAGEERNAGECNTPGFTLQNVACLSKECQSFKKLLMPRNNKSVLQTSKDMLRSWRANCDIQLLIYETDPINPDPKEISRVVNYIVGYSCKGGHTHAEERNQLYELTNR